MEISTFLRIFTVAIAILALGRAGAVDKPSHKHLPDLDKRAAKAADKRQETAAKKQQAASQRLKSRVNHAKVDFHEVHGAPQWIRGSAGFLSDPEPRPT